MSHNIQRAAIMAFAVFRLSATVGIAAENPGSEPFPSRAEAVAGVVRAVAHHLDELPGLKRRACRVRFHGENERELTAVFRDELGKEGFEQLDSDAGQFDNVPEIEVVHEYRSPEGSISATVGDGPVSVARYRDIPWARPDAPRVASIGAFVLVVARSEWSPDLSAARGGASHDAAEQVAAGSELEPYLALIEAAPYYEIVDLKGFGSGEVVRVTRRVTLRQCDLDEISSRCKTKRSRAIATVVAVFLVSLGIRLRFGVPLLKPFLYFTEN